MKTQRTRSLRVALSSTCWKQCAAVLLAIASFAGLPVAAQYAPPTSGTSSALVFSPATLNLVAGLNGEGYGGTGGPANSTSTTFNYPVGLAYDSNGNLFITDSENEVVRRIDHTTGDISTFAGNNMFGTLAPAPGAQATNVSLGYVTGLAVDKNNNVYFADRTNHVVWKVDTTGVITIFAGTIGDPGYTGDGGAAASATLDAPWGIAFDAAGNLYIADQSNHVIRRVDTSNNIHTFAGDGTDAGTFSCPNAYSGDGGPATSAEFCYPYGVAVDPAGNVYISDYKFAVVKVVHTDGSIHAFAGNGTPAFGHVGDGGAATAANLYEPFGLYADPTGNIYIVDQFGSSVREVGSTGIIETIFGVYQGGLSKSAIGEPDNEEVTVGTGPADGIYYVTMDKFGNLLEADSSGETLTSAGTVGQYVFGEIAPYTTTPPAYVTVINPSGVALTFSGTPTVSNSFAIVTGTGAGTCNLAGSLAAGASCTIGITFSPTVGGIPGTLVTGSIVLTSNSNSSPNTINLSGTGYGTIQYEGSITSPPSAYTSPMGVTSAAQQATLTNTGNPPITISSTAFSSGGTKGFAVSSTTCPTSPATLAGGASCVFNITFTPPAATSYTDQFQVNIANYGIVSANLSGTGTPAIPPPVSGPQLQFVPAEVNLFAGTGNLCNDTGDGGPALSATLCNVTSVAVDQVGNTYIVDQAYNTVRKVDVHGNISTFAGVPVHAGFTQSSGDGGLATAAYIDVPTDVAVDPSGNVYIAESYASHIREVNVSTGIITTFVGGASGTFHGGTGAGVAIGEPIGIAFDPSGNLYIGTFGQFVVIKVTPAGVATALAGTGVAGYNGDNIPATTAELTNPLYVASDLSGNIYIEDGNSNTMANCRIRKVTASTGAITTVAGDGPCNTTGDGGAATSAQIYLGFGPLSVDLAGDIFFNTVGSAGTGVTVRKVDVLGNINTVIGGGAAQLSGYPVSATATYFSGINAARLDNNGNLVMPVVPPANSNYADQVAVAGSTGILQFGNQNVNSTSAPMSVTLENSGSATLTLSQTTYTATGNFAVSGGTCVGKSTLASGATCTLTVTFSPLSPGALTGAISVGSNAAVGTDSVVLQGTGIALTAPGASLSPATVPFGSQTVNTTSGAQTVVLSNTGTGPLTGIVVTLTGANPGDFADTSACGTTLAAGASCNISVTFTPASAASFTATLSVADNATGSPQTASLTGTGTAAPTPVATLTPTLAFGNQTVNITSAAMTAVLSNTGNAALTGIVVSLTGANPGDFADTSACGTTLAAGASCNISVTFTPASAASFTATLSVADNATGSPQTATLTGTGTTAPAPVATLTPTLAFGSQTVNITSAPMTAVLSNTGNAALTGIVVSLTGANPGDFADTSACGTTLAAGASCNISVTFTPASAASFTATLSVADNATGSPQTATLTGTGTTAPAPVATLTPSTAAFGNQTVNTTSAAKTLTLSNTGNASLSSIAISVTGANPTDFAYTTTCGTTLAAAASCTINVTFTPLSSASFAATISVADNATGSPQTATLTGTGTAVPAPIATLSPGALTFASTTIGTSAQAQTLTLSNTGNATLSSIAVMLGGTNSADFAYTTTCGTTLAAAATCSISVTFTPATVATFTAAITVTDNAAGSPQTSTLSGTGVAPGATDFSLTSPTPPQTVPNGATASFVIDTAALTGSYNTPIVLSVTGLPIGAIASFNPPSVTPGSVVATATLAVQTPSLTASAAQTHSPLPWLAALLVVPLLAFRRKMRSVICVLLLAMLSAFLVGCGGGYFGPQAQTYTLTVTGTSGAIQHSTTVTLTVQ